MLRDPYAANLEAVFAAFEMAKLFGRCEGLTSEIEHLPQAMQTVIVVTLEKLMKFPVRDGVLRPPQVHGQFSQRSRVSSTGQSSPHFRQNGPSLLQFSMGNGSYG